MDVDSVLKSIINQSAIEMMDRMKHIKDKDDRSALLFEVGEWCFMDFDLEDELFLPKLEKSNVEC